MHIQILYKVMYPLLWAPTTDQSTVCTSPDAEFTYTFCHIETVMNSASMLMNNQNLSTADGTSRVLTITHQLSPSADCYDLQAGQASMNAYCPLLNIIFSSLTPATSARCLLCAFSLCPAQARSVL